MTTSLPTTSTEEFTMRLRRVEGQVRGLQHMVERGDRCLDVLTQIAAARGALGAVGRGLLDREIRRILDTGAPVAADSVDDVLAAVELLANR